MFGGVCVCVCVRERERERERERDVFNFVLHDMFYCAVFNLCNLLCMSV